MIRSIPPITSTGTQRKKPVQPKRPTRISSWDISKHIFKKPKEEKAKKIIFQPAQKVECISELVEEINTDGDLGMILKFKGLNLSNKFFAKGRKYYGPNTCVYYTNIIYKKKYALLLISTTGDIVESEIVPLKKGVNQLFSNEVYIPKLIGAYDPLSMEVTQNNSFVIITYKKQ